MTTLQTLVVRDDTSISLSPTVVNLLIALLCLSIVAVVLATTLIFVRHLRARKAMQYALPTHQTGKPQMATTLSPPTAQRAKRGHRRTISITTAPYKHDLVGPKDSFDSEKAYFLNGSSTAGAPRAGVPEIHITFPDEDRDVNEKRHSGRVVVVRINDNGGIGLAPYLEPGLAKSVEGLPAYSEFMSLDLEKLGGLREKKENVWA